VVFRDGLRLPSDAVRWLLFAFSLLLGAGMSFALDVLIGSLAFWFEDISAVDRARNLLARTLSGALIPLVLFPTTLTRFLGLQPFGYMVSFPLEVLIGHPAGGLFYGFVIQVAWFAVFLAGAAAVWRIGLRRYQGAGA
jgi:ABC-2 type transport system permease protein